MEMKLLCFISFALAERSINDDEYQTPTRRALQPAQVHSLGKVQNHSLVFLPIFKEKPLLRQVPVR